MTQNHEELVTVYISQGPLNAEVVRSKLESAGIPVLLRYEAIGRILGLTVDGLGKVEVQVPVEHEAEARDLVEEMDDLPPDAEIEPPAPDPTDTPPTAGS